jgi:predicted ATP-dependent protease
VEKIMTTISEFCWGAVTWIDGLAQSDADAAVQTLLDRVVAVLRRDPRMPRLTSEAWRLLFADTAARSRDELGALISGKVDLGEVITAIVEELATKANKSNRKPRQQADAETGETQRID